MKRIDPQTTRRILDTAQIVEVVSDFVKLRRSGNSYMGLCPFHNERTPSFSVSPSRNYCKCFSCGKGGSPVNFVMELEKLTYQEALRYLARKYNIEIEERDLTPEEIREQGERESMLAVNDWALKYFEDTLTGTDEGRAVGRAYFIERGLTEQAMKKFRLGYCTESYDAMHKQAVSQGYTEQYLSATGLTGRTASGRLYDRFRARVIYPIFSVSGKVIGFGGRRLGNADNVAKYVNSPESIIYNKRNELYGLYQAKNSMAGKDRVFLVEGYMDVISMYMRGVENVVASSGTSLTVGQIRLIRRFTKNVTVVYDSDAAGIKASLRGIDLLLGEGLNVKVLQFPPGEDPDSFAQSHSPEELADYIKENETDFIRFKTTVLLGGGAGSDPTVRAQAISDICRSIASIPDLINRTVYITETSRTLGIDESVVALQVAKYMASNAENRKTEQQRQNAAATIEDVDKPDLRATSAAGRREQPPVDDDGRRILEPFEREIIRYVVKYGMMELNLIGADDTEIRYTLVDYLARQMEYEGMEFTSAACRKTFEAACRLAHQKWDSEYSLFRGNLEIDARKWRLEGQEQIRNREGGVENLAAAERQLEAAVEKRIAEHDRAFRLDYLAKTLSSAEDDDVRRLANELAPDRYRISRVYRRMGFGEDEIEQLDQRVARAFCEWQDATLDVELEKVNRQLVEATKANTDFVKVRELLSKKTELIGYKREFAKALGERIVVPKR